MAAAAVWFSEEDVRRQLQALGYADVPRDVFEDFFKGAVPGRLLFSVDDGGSPSSGSGRQI